MDKTTGKHVEELQEKTFWRDGLWSGMGEVECGVDLGREYSEKHCLGLRSAFDVNIGEDVSGEQSVVF